MLDLVPQLLRVLAHSAEVSATIHFGTATLYFGLATIYFGLATI